MSDNTSFEQEIGAIIQLVQNAKTENFFEIAKILGRDPKKDLAGADLHSCDLSGGDLRGANLRKTNLSSANLRGANLRGADLSYADLSGADFTGADLRDTIFYEVRAENAIFCINQGIYERLKLQLIEKGAIFKKEAIASEFPNPNVVLYEKLLLDPKSREKYEGMYVAIFEGELVGYDTDKDKLIARINSQEQFSLSKPFIKQIQDDEPIESSIPISRRSEFDLD